MRRRLIAFAAAGASGALLSPDCLAQACFEETQCTFERPNVLIVMDYSSSMAQEAFGDATRWEAQLEAVRRLTDTRELTSDLHLGLSRFGHDPSTSSGTTLPGDTSSPRLRDGFALDIPFDDASGSYTECNAQGLHAALDGLPPPPTGQSLIGTWTRGALESALAHVHATRANHPADRNRVYEVVLMTDGEWNCRDSFDRDSCDGDPGEPDDRPTPAAAALLAEGVRVHVVAFGDGTSSTELDSLARAGGTTAALDAASPEELTSTLRGVLREVRDAVVVPECIGGLPRVMIVMDSSSSMLVGSAPGESNWDKARFALSGNPWAPSPGDPGYVQPLFDRTVQVSGQAVAIEDVVHIGLLGFNHTSSQQLMLQYAPCSRDNVEWAMDPYTSCVAPGCIDPYTDSDETLDFTSRESDLHRNPPFVQNTTSFMPPCNSGGPARCTGFAYTTYVGEGVNAARMNLARYMVDPGAFPLDPDTPFVNVLVSDGRNAPNDPLDPRPILTDMRQSGVPTWVIGFGGPEDLDVAELDSYASAGGTGMAFIVNPDAGDSASQLADRIAQVIATLDIDPCCQLNDCSESPEPPLPFCGNGRLDPGEACDDGTRNGSLNGTCAASCASVTYCGDGVVTGAELCDDANRIQTDACSYCGADPGAGGSGSGVGGNAGTGATGAGASAGSGAAPGSGAATGSGAAPGAGAAGGQGGTSSGSGASPGSGATGTGSGARSGLVDGGVAGGDASDGNAAASAGDEGSCACRQGRRAKTESPGAAWLGLAALGLLGRRRRA